MTLEIDFVFKKKKHIFFMMSCNKQIEFRQPKSTPTAILWDKFVCPGFGEG